MGKHEEIKIILAKLCIYFSGKLKFAAFILRPGIVSDALSLDGWYIIGYQLVYNKRIISKTPCIEMKCYTMPDEYCKQLDKLALRKG